MPKKKNKKIWSTVYADKQFSKAIIKRDKKCLRCSKINQLTCSHYWTRYYSAARYNYRNCITLCIGCHFKWEEEKQGEYRDFMLQYLGQEEFDKLRMETHKTVKRKDAIKQLMLNL